MFQHVLLVFRELFESTQDDETTADDNKLRSVADCGDVYASTRIRGKVCASARVSCAGARISVVFGDDNRSLLKSDTT